MLNIKSFTRCLKQVSAFFNFNNKTEPLTIDKLMMKAPDEPLMKGRVMNYYKTRAEKVTESKDIEREMMKKEFLHESKTSRNVSEQSRRSLAIDNFPDAHVDDLTKCMEQQAPKKCNDEENPSKLNISDPVDILKNNKAFNDDMNNNVNHLDELIISANDGKNDSKNLYKGKKMFSNELDLKSEKMNSNLTNETRKSFENKDVSNVNVSGCDLEYDTLNHSQEQHDTTNDIADESSSIGQTPRNENYTKSDDHSQGAWRENLNMNSFMNKENIALTETYDNIEDIKTRSIKEDVIKLNEYSEVNNQMKPDNDVIEVVNQNKSDMTAMIDVTVQSFFDGNSKKMKCVNIEPSTKISQRDSLDFNMTKTTKNVNNIHHKSFQYQNAKKSITQNNADHSKMNFFKGFFKDTQINNSSVNKKNHTKYDVDCNRNRIKDTNNFGDRFYSDERQIIKGFFETMKPINSNLITKKSISNLTNIVCSKKEVTNKIINSSEEHKTITKLVPKVTSVAKNEFTAVDNLAPTDEYMKLDIDLVSQPRFDENKEPDKKELVNVDKDEYQDDKDDTKENKQKLVKVNFSDINKEKQKMSVSHKDTSDTLADQLSGTNNSSKLNINKLVDQYGVNNLKYANEKEGNVKENYRLANEAKIEQPTFYSMIHCPFRLNDAKEKKEFNNYYKKVYSSDNLMNSDVKKKKNLRYNNYKLLNHEMSRNINLKIKKPLAVIKRRDYVLKMKNLKKHFKRKNIVQCKNKVLSKKGKVNVSIKTDVNINTDQSTKNCDFSTDKDLKEVTTENKLNLNTRNDVAKEKCYSIYNKTTNQVKRKRVDLINMLSNKSSRGDYYYDKLNEAKKSITSITKNTIRKKCSEKINNYKTSANCKTNVKFTNKEMNIKFVKTKNTELKSEIKSPINTYSKNILSHEKVKSCHTNIKAVNKNNIETFESCKIKTIVNKDINMHKQTPTNQNLEKHKAIKNNIINPKYTKEATTPGDSKIFDKISQPNCINTKEKVESTNTEIKNCETDVKNIKLINNKNKNFVCYSMQNESENMTNKKPNEKQSDAITSYSSSRNVLEQDNRNTITKSSELQNNDRLDKEMMFNLNKKSEEILKVLNSQCDNEDAKIINNETDLNKYEITDNFEGKFIDIKHNLSTLKTSATITNIDKCQNTEELSSIINENITRSSTETINKCKETENTPIVNTNDITNKSIESISVVSMDKDVKLENTTLNENSNINDITILSIEASIINGKGTEEETCFTDVQTMNKDDKFENSNSLTQITNTNIIRSDFECNKFKNLDNSTMTMNVNNVAEIIVDKDENENIFVANTNPIDETNTSELNKMKNGYKKNSIIDDFYSIYNMKQEIEKQKNLANMKSDSYSSTNKIYKMNKFESVCESLKPYTESRLEKIYTAVTELNEKQDIKGENDKQTDNTPMITEQNTNLEMDEINNKEVLVRKDFSSDLLLSIYDNKTANNEKKDSLNLKHVDNVTSANYEEECGNVKRHHKNDNCNTISQLNKFKYYDGGYNTKMSTYTVNKNTSFNMYDPFQEYGLVTQNVDNISKREELDIKYPADYEIGPKRVIANIPTFIKLLAIFAEYQGFTITDELMYLSRRYEEMLSEAVTDNDVEQFKHKDIPIPSERDKFFTNCLVDSESKNSDMVNSLELINSLEFINSNVHSKLLDELFNDESDEKNESNKDCCSNTLSEK